MITLKMEAAVSSKSFTPVYQDTEFHIPEGSNIHCYHCEEFRSHKSFILNNSEISDLICFKLHLEATYMHTCKMFVYTCFKWKYPLVCYRHFMTWNDKLWRLRRHSSNTNFNIIQYVNERLQMHRQYVEKILYHDFQNWCKWKTTGIWNIWFANQWVWQWTAELWLMKL